MTTNTMRLAGGFAVLYAARRYYRNWGTTKEECRMYLDGDGRITGSVVRSTEAVSIDARLAWSGRGWFRWAKTAAACTPTRNWRTSPGCGIVNADRVHPEWQHLAPGDTIRLVPKGWMGLREGIALQVVEVADQQSIVLRAAAGRRMGRGVVVPRHSSSG